MDAFVVAYLIKRPKILAVIPVISYFSTALCSFPPFVCRGCLCPLCSINYSLSANEYFIGCWTPSSYLPNLVMSLFSVSYPSSAFILHLSHPLPDVVSVWIFMYWMCVCVFVCLLLVNVPWFTSTGIIKRDDADLMLCYLWARVTLYCSGCSGCVLCMFMFGFVFVFVLVPRKELSFQGSEKPSWIPH